MRAVSQKFHGIFDYSIGGFLIFSPVVFGYGEGGPETITPVVIGCLIMLYSSFTDYDQGILKQIPLFIHHWFDLFTGLLLCSPWILSVEKLMHWPVLFAGLLLIIVSIVQLTYDFRVTRLLTGKFRHISDNLSKHANGILDSLPVKHKTTSTH